MEGQEVVQHQGGIREQIVVEQPEQQRQAEVAPPKWIKLTIWGFCLEAEGSPANIMTAGMVGGGLYLLYKSLNNPQIVNSFCGVLESFASRAVTTSIREGSLYVKVLTCGKDSQEELLDAYFMGSIFQKYQENVEKVFKEKMKVEVDQITLEEVGVIRANENDFNDIVQEARDAQKNFDGLHGRKEIIFSNHQILKDDNRVLKQKISEDDSKDIILNIINHLMETLDQKSKSSSQSLHSAETDMPETKMAGLTLSKQIPAQHSKSGTLPLESSFHSSMTDYDQVKNFSETLIQKIKQFSGEEEDVLETKVAGSTSRKQIPAQHSKSGTLPLESSFHSSMTGEEEDVSETKMAGPTSRKQKILAQHSKSRTFLKSFSSYSWRGPFDDGSQLLSLWVQLYELEDSSLMKRAAEYFPSVLHLSRIHLNEIQVRAFSEILRFTNKFIEWISLRNCQLRSSSLRQISTALLESKSTVGLLDISGNQFDGVEDVVELIPRVSRRMSLFDCFTDGRGGVRDANKEERKKIHRALDECNSSLEVRVDNPSFDERSNCDVTILNSTLQPKKSKGSKFIVT